MIDRQSQINQLGVSISFIFSRPSQCPTEWKNGIEKILSRLSFGCKWTTEWMKVNLKVFINYKYKYYIFFIVFCSSVLKFHFRIITVLYPFTCKTITFDFWSYCSFSIISNESKKNLFFFLFCLLLLLPLPPDLQFTDERWMKTYINYVLCHCCIVKHAFSNIKMFHVPKLWSARTGSVLSASVGATDECCFRWSNECTITYFQSIIRSQLCASWTILA